MKKRTKKTYRKLHIGNQGSAMITALIVSVVVVMFCLTALVVSYSLFASSSKRVTQDQCRELAKSASLELQNELADSSSALCGYLDTNIINGTGWAYYNENEEDHGTDAAYRYFKMNVSGGETGTYAAYTDDISVCMYWEKGQTASGKELKYLNVKVTCTRGDESASMTSRYRYIALLRKWNFVERD